MHQEQGAPVKDRSSKARRGVLPCSNGDTPLNALGARSQGRPLKIAACWPPKARRLGQ